MGRDGDTKWGPFVAVTLIAAITGSLFFLQDPLESQRPGQQAQVLQPGAPEEMVMARLWQDPLSAIQAHWKVIVTHWSENDKAPPLTPLPRTINQMRPAFTPESSVAVSEEQAENRGLRLLAVVPGGPYADDVEQRRRQRYAVVSALTERDYVPEDAENIGYFVAPAFRLPSQQKDDQPILIGYERFRRALEIDETGEPEEGSDRAPDWKSIEVLWLNDADFAEYPLHQIPALMAALDTPLPEAGYDLEVRETVSPGAPTTVLLGPGTSGALRQMWDTANDDQGIGVAEDFFERVAKFPLQLLETPLFTPTDSSTFGLPLVDQIVASVDRYLDYGLAPMETGDLYDCLEGSGTLDECLQTGEVAGIADSNPEWREWITSMWGSGSVVAAADRSEIGSALANQRSQLSVLSPRATVPLDRLLRNELESDALNAGEVVDSEDGSPEPLKTGADVILAEDSLRDELDIARFRSVLARDDMVLRDILFELEARGICHTDGGGLSIAIVAEQDTVYGRLLDDIVEDWASDLKAHGELPCGDDIEIAEFGYLRGIDGELPPGSQVQGFQGNESDGLTSGGIRAFGGLLAGGDSEEVVGVAQLDYIRRLGDTISYTNSVERSEGSDGFVAIGILGSDVYDKQLILQVLRSRLPDAVFFTTDLDARLSAPDSYEWTRNLLVGSAYGLSIENQKGAGFRDSYQAALYRAVYIALDLPVEPAIWAPDPRLFEIGRSGPIDITNCRSESCEESARVHGELPYMALNSKTDERVRFTLVVLSPLLALTLLAFWTSSKQHALSRPFRAEAYVGLAGALCSLVLWCVVWSWPEPRVLFEGVSSIPTLVLHVTTAVFAAYIVASAVGRMVQGHREIESEYSLPGSATQKWNVGHRLKSAPLIYRWHRSLSVRKFGRPKPAVKVWKRYLAFSHWRGRTARILLPVTAWTVLVVWMVQQEPAPLLINQQQLLMEIVRGFTIFAVVGTIFFCTDTLHLGQTVIRDLARHDIKGWKKTPPSHDALDEYVSRRWQTMGLIVRCTEIVGPIVILPFVLMVLLMVARSTIFEGWIWTPTLLAFYMGFSAHILLRALRFQFEAVRARERILANIDLHQHQVAGNEVQSRRLDLVMKEIDSIRRGAFVPWTRHPILQSVVLPSGGFGLLTLLNSLM